MTKEQKGKANDKKYQAYLAYQREYQRKRRNATSAYLNEIRIREYKRAQKDFASDSINKINKLDIPIEYKNKVLDIIKKLRDKI